MSCGDLIATSAMVELATNTDSTGLSMRTSCPWLTWIASVWPDATLVTSWAAATDISGPGATVSISSATADAAPERRIFIVIIPLLIQSLRNDVLDGRITGVRTAHDLNDVLVGRMHELVHRAADLGVVGVGLAALRNGVVIGGGGARLVLRLALLGPARRIGRLLREEARRPRLSARDRRSAGFAVRHAQAAQAERQLAHRCRNLDHLRLLGRHFDGHGVDLLGLALDVIEVAVRRQQTHVLEHRLRGLRLVVGGLRLAV